MAESLFDEIDRTETQPKNERESFFDYYNSSARKPVAAARLVLDQWFESYPTNAKKDLRERLRSSRDSQHVSAFWELYLYELFTQMGFTLEAGPIVAGDLHPDFLVSAGAIPKFYLEAVVAGLASVEDAGADARLSEVVDLINKIKSPHYCLYLQLRGTPNTPPPTRELRRGLEEWLNSLTFEEIEEKFRSNGFEGLPQHKWSHEGLTLLFRPIPKSRTTRGSTESRPIGFRIGEAEWIAVDNDIRKVLEVKSKKYDQLPLPLVVGVNCVNEYCEESDLYNALFGNELIDFVPKPDGSWTLREGRRKPNGVWFGKEGPRNTHLSAVLLGCIIDPYTSGNTTPLLVHNPNTQKTLTSLSYPLPQLVPNNANCTMERIEGKKANQILRLPTPWPPTRD